MELKRDEAKGLFLVFPVKACRICWEIALARVITSLGVKRWRVTR